jgi:hypothetical protein
MCDPCHRVAAIIGRVIWIRSYCVLGEELACSTHLSLSSTLAPLTSDVTPLLTVRRGDRQETLQFSREPWYFPARDLRDRLYGKSLTFQAYGIA